MFFFAGPTNFSYRNNEVLAVKVLDVDKNEEEIKDIQLEVNFLSNLKNCPNVSHYYGSILEGTKLWIIMEYCAGGSLRSLLKAGRLEERYIGVITRELLIALSFIHKAGVIHRDIKAANVLVTREGNVQLCDFGVAAQLTANNSKRITMAGTPFWMAPEVILEGTTYSYKVDIWSLGITVYELLTGNPPYCDKDPKRAMQLIAKQKPPRLQGNNYSLLIKDFVALCLDENPQERPMAEELLKSKFIRHHKSSSTAILREIVSRFLVWREKKASRDSIALLNQNPELLKDSDSRRSSIVSGDIPQWDFESMKGSEEFIESDLSSDSINSFGGEDSFDFGGDDNFSKPFNSNNDQEIMNYTFGNTEDPVYLNSTINATTLKHNNNAMNGSEINESFTMGEAKRQEQVEQPFSMLNFSQSISSKKEVPKSFLDLFGDDGLKSDPVPKKPPLMGTISSPLITTDKSLPLPPKSFNTSNITSPHGDLEIPSFDGLGLDNPPSSDIYLGRSPQPPALQHSFTATEGITYEAKTSPLNLDLHKKPMPLNSNPGGSRTPSPRKPGYNGTLPVNTQHQARAKNNLSSSFLKMELNLHQKSLLSLSTLGEGQIAPPVSTPSSRSQSPSMGRTKNLNNLRIEMPKPLLEGLEGLGVPSMPSPSSKSPLVNSYTKPDPNVNQFGFAGNAPKTMTPLTEKSLESAMAPLELKEEPEVLEEEKVAKPSMTSNLLSRKISSSSLATSSQQNSISTTRDRQMSISSVSSNENGDSLGVYEKSAAVPVVPNLNPAVFLDSTPKGILIDELERVLVGFTKTLDIIQDRLNVLNE